MVSGFKPSFSKGVSGPRCRDFTGFYGRFPRFWHFMWEATGLGRVSRGSITKALRV